MNLLTLSRTTVFSDIFAISLADWDVPKLLFFGTTSCWVSFPDIELSSPLDPRL